MQCKAKYYICYGFWHSSENSKKWNQNINFLGFFQRFLDHALLRPMGHAQIFCQMKFLMKIHNRVKFHRYRICGCEVINFPMFSWRCIIHEMGHFWGFLGPNSPKYCQIFSKFLPEVVFKETQTVFEEFWKNSNFYRNGRHPNLLRLVPLWPPFSPWRWPKSEEIKGAGY